MLQWLPDGLVPNLVCLSCSLQFLSHHGVDASIVALPTWEEHKTLDLVQKVRCMFAACGFTCVVVDGPGTNLGSSLLLPFHQLCAREAVSRAR